MSAPVYRTGVAACARFASSTLQRACIAHRAALLETCATLERRRYRHSCRRQYSAAVSNSLPTTIDDSLTIDEPAARSASNDVASEHVSLASAEPQVHQSIRLLDPYLPLELRSRTWLENLADFQGVRDPATLPAILLEIDGNFERGVLTSLALEQNRWPAFVYLSEAIARACHSCRSDTTALVVQDSIFKRMSLPHPYRQRDINNYVEFYWKLPLTPDTTSSAKATKLVSFEADLTLARTHANAMGMLWQSLGRIILAAADASREVSEKLMINVHRVLSFLHNEDQMHPKIYQFDSDSIPAVYRKSPLLHLMSSRIMTAISDSSWRAVEDRVIDSYTWMGAAYASSGGLELKDLYPAVRNIGAEVWLDLVLWSCVHGGHVAAGASLLRELASYQGDSKWYSISWPALIEDNLQKTDHVNAKKIRARFDRVAGAHEGYSKDPPVVTLPKRTVSKESVIALVNNMTVPPEQTLDNYSTLDASMFDNLSRGPSPLLDRSFLNLVATRSVEFASFNPKTRPEFFDSVTDVISLGRDSNSYSASVRQQKQDPSQTIGAMDSIHHRAIAAMIDMGDLDRTLRAFMKLQNWLDSKKQAALTSFFLTSARNMDTETDDVYAERAANHEVLDQYSAPLPPVTLAAFLDLLVKHRMLDLATWLLSSEDPDGPFVSSQARSSAVFIPALLRFATVTNQYNIVLEVADLIRRNDRILTNDVLHAFTQAQMAFRQFDQAETTMRVMRQLEVDDVSTQDVMVLLREILRLEHELSSPSSQTIADVNTSSAPSINSASRLQLEAGIQLFANILQRRFLRDHTRDPQLNLRLRYSLNQLGRIAQSLGGELEQTVRRIRRGLSIGLRIQEGTVPITADDFNILLQGVVETRGPSAGRKLIEQWCLLPSRRPPSRLLRRDDLPVIIGPEFSASFSRRTNPAVRDWDSKGEGVVVPNKQTMQILIDAETDQAESRSQSDSQVDIESAAVSDTARSDNQTLQPVALGLSWDDTPEAGEVSGSPEAESLVTWCEQIRDSLGN